MADPLWARVEEIFHRTRSLPEGTRAAFLDDVTDGEPDVRHRVESLLAAHDDLESREARGRGGFLETLHPEHAGALLAADDSPDVGPAPPASIGRYRVERLLGRGGMGAVYLAHDPKLGRSVALKLLSPGLDADEDAWGRVLAEARASSALDHPNIATVYDVGRSDVGPFVAMAYHPGPTLRERLDAGPVEPDEAAAWALAVAEGLAAAHAAGIVHRDVKPENLVLAADGSVRIVDFGIARAVAHATGRLPRGTVAYMSPEQTRGEAVDARSDVWSVGVVLYEMLAGRRPFSGQAPDAVIHAIRHDDPPDLPAGPRSAALDAVVRRCLARAPGDRFADGAALAAALRGVERGAVPPRTPTSRRAAGLVVAAAGVVALLGIGALSGDGGGETAQDLVPPTIVLADLEGEGPAGAVARAATEALRIDLLQSPALRLVDREQLQPTLVRMGRAGAAGLPEEAAREVAARDGHAAVVAGSVAAVGRGWLLSARVVDPSGTTVVAFRETAADSTDLVAAVDRLAKGVRDRLGESADDLRAARPLPEVATASLPALSRYAEAHWISASGGDQSRAVGLLEDAIALDPDFAAAHRALAVALWNMRGDRDRAVRAATRAYELRDRLGLFERHVAEAAWQWQVRGDPFATAEAYRRALHLRPRHSVASNNLALALMFLGRFGEAERVLRDATEPGAPGGSYALLRQNLARTLYLQGRTDEAFALLDSALAVEGGDPAAALERARWLGGEGRWDEAEAESRAFVAGHEGHPQFQAEGIRLGWHLALARGRFAEAEARYRRLDALLADLGVVEARARAALRRAEAYRVLLGDTGRARSLVMDLVASDDLDLLTAGAGLAPRAAATLAALGDTVAALALVDRWEDQPEERRSDPDLLSPELARARVDRAGGRPETAVRRLTDVLEFGVHDVDYLPDLAFAQRDAGRHEDAVETLERFLVTRHVRRAYRVSSTLGPTLKELARLRAAAGDSLGARAAGQRLADLWADADVAVWRAHGGRGVGVAGGR